MPLPALISFLPLPPRPPGSQVPAIDKSDGALQRRGKLLGALLQHPSIDARSLDAQGRTFLFYTCSWANSSKDLFPLLCHLLWLARKLGVAVNQQARHSQSAPSALVLPSCHAALAVVNLKRCSTA